MNLVLKEKLKNLLFPFSFKKNYEGKWWHRLALVLTFGTTGLIFILGVVVWFNTYGSPISTYQELQGFSFETNYKDLHGKEVSCYYVNESDYYSGGIFCRDGNHQVYDDKDFLKKYFASNSPKYEKIRSEIIQKYKDGELKSFNDILPLVLNDNTEVYAKYKTIFNFFFYNLYLIPLIAFGWYIFWTTLVYRAVLYIIFGTKN